MPLRVFGSAHLMLISPAAAPLLRRYVVHVLLALVAIGFAFAHSAALVAIGVAAWALDLLLRYVWMAGEVGVSWGQGGVRGRGGK